MSRSKAQNEAVKDELLGILKREGRITAETVAEKAKDPKTALHAEYEWDKDKVFEDYLLDRSREIIRFHHEWIDMNGAGRARVPVFISPSSGSGDESGYVRTSEATQTTILKLAIRDLGAYLDRYRGMLKLVGVMIPADSEIIHFLGLDVAAETKKRGRRRRVA